MVYPSINTKWVCNQGGEFEITVISELNDMNYDEFGHKKRTGEIIYIYHHNNKVGNMIKYDEYRWEKEWKQLEE